MQKLKIVALKFLYSKSGAILAPVIAGAFTYLGTELAKFGITLTEDQQNSIVAWVTASIIALLQFFLAKHAGDTNEKVQEAVGGIEVDRYVGPVTIKAIARQVEPPAPSVVAGKPKRKAPRITGRKS